jgi:hypothetical protein
VGPLIVEFVGLPASGKSTTARRVAKLLGARGYRCGKRPPIVKSRIDHLRHAFRLMIYRYSRWRLLGSLLGYAASIRPLSIGRVGFVKQMMFLSYYFEQQKDSGYDVILMDQSFVQAAWGALVHGEAFPRSPAASLFSALYRRNEALIAFVYLDIDPRTAAVRATQRRTPGNRFDRLPLDEVEELFVDYRNELSEVIRCAVSVTSAPMMSLDGSAPGEDTAECIVRWIEGVLAESGRARD